MKLVDVIIAPTSKSLSHTDSRREASKNGVRIATLPGITEDTMVRTLNADYYKIAERSKKVARILERVKGQNTNGERMEGMGLPIPG